MCEGRFGFGTKMGLGALKKAPPSDSGRSSRIAGSSIARMGEEGMPVKATHDADPWTILLLDPESGDAVPQSGSFRLLQRVRQGYGESLRNLFVLCAASELERAADVVSAVNRRHQLRALFVRQDADPEWLPQLFDRANFRALRNTFIHSDLAVPRRVLTAWKHRAEKQLIANATVVDDKLLIMSCEPQTIEIAFDSIRALARIPLKQRNVFTISDDGSYIHWPASDTHLDLDAIRSVIDPNWRDECDARTVAHNKTFGQRVAMLRRHCGLRQSDIAGLSERQVRRIEAGEAPTADALRFLAASHNMDLAAYLNAVAEATEVGQRTGPALESVVA
jgi:hypothetical protein